MKAPLSSHIAKVLRDNRSAENLVDAVLKERAAGGHGLIAIRVGEEVKRYKRITEIKS